MLICAIAMNCRKLGSIGGMGMPPGGSPGAPTTPAGGPMPGNGSIAPPGRPGMMPPAWAETCCCCCCCCGCCCCCCCYYCCEVTSSNLAGSPRRTARTVAQGMARCSPPFLREVYCSAYPSLVCLGLGVGLGLG